MPETHSVCYVNELGEVVCPNEELTAAYETLRSDIEAVFPGDPNRVELILRLIKQVMESPLNDACIGARTPDTVASVKQVLAQQAPVMLLYRYFRLPGNIMATYYLQQGNYVGAYTSVVHWSTTKPACPP